MAKHQNELLMSMAWSSTMVASSRPYPFLDRGLTCEVDTIMLVFFSNVMNCAIACFSSACVMPVKVCL